MPCGKKAAFATTGYFAKQRNRRGRQLGRGLATRSGALVVDRLCSGTTQRPAALPPLVRAAAQPLDLDADKRGRTGWRIEAGGGRVEEVHGLLGPGYHVHGKD